MQQADMRITNSRFLRGFTLVEMCIVVLVLSIMVGGIMTAVTQNIRISNQGILQKRMDAIEEALLTFRKKYDRLPCPADITRVMTSANFGKEGATPGTCTGGTPAANFDDSSNTVGGGVPVKDLGLADEYSFDPWGGRFLYAVDKRLTGSTSFTTYPMADTTIGDIEVRDADAATLATKVVVVLLSYGPNGHGAHLLSGNIKSTGSYNTNELENCDCDSDAVAGTFNEIFIQQNAATSGSDILAVFDDIVHYYRRPNFASSTDLLTESR